MGSTSLGGARGFALLLVCSSVLGALSWLWWGATKDSGIRFLPERTGAAWIVYPNAASGSLHPSVELSTIFRRVFLMERAPAQATLSVAGFRHYSVSLNGHALDRPLRTGKSWKQADRFDVSSWLRTGSNEVLVTVFNSNAPPALWLSLRASGFELDSSESWEASYADGAWRSPRLADKPKVFVPGSSIYGGEGPLASLQKRWPTLVVFMALSMGVRWVIGRKPWRADRKQGGERKENPSELRSGAAAGQRIKEGIPVLALAGLWLALFANNLGALPALVGYDIAGHLDYVAYIQERHALPLAAEGWEMFQPPLYYVVCAALLELMSLSVNEAGGMMALRVAGMGIGIAHFTVVWKTLRLLFPGDRARWTWGTVLAACLPPVLYLSQYVSNEGPAAALVSASVYLCLSILKSERPSWGRFVGLGLCLGAALLTKTTAVLVLLPIVGALLWKAITRHELDPGARAAELLPLATQPMRASSLAAMWRTFYGPILAVLVCVLTSGWHYARLWQHYGTPFIGAWDPRTGFFWWQDDGYRTGGFYLRFGQALIHPWFSALKGFGDGIYSTLWGDGLTGGVDLPARPPWHYDLMAIGYWLALAPSLAVAIGGVLAVRNFLRRPSAEWFLVLGLGFVVMFAIVHTSMSVPFYCMVKAFYGLSALVPFCALGAWGTDFLCCRLAAVALPGGSVGGSDATSRCRGRFRVVSCAAAGVAVLIGVWAVNSYASFWISRSSVLTLLARASSLAREKRPSEAAQLLESSLDSGAESADVRAALADILLAEEQIPAARLQAELAAQAKPNDGIKQFVLARAMAFQGEIEEAVAHTRRAIELAPGNGEAHQQLSELLLQQNRVEEAERAAREGLAIDPFRCGLRLALAGTMMRRDELTAAISQLELAVRLQPESTRAHLFLAMALHARHDTGEAIRHYGEALRLKPDLPEALNDLAWILATSPQEQFRNGAEAVRLAERACQLTEYRQAMLVGTLAAAYAETGRFKEGAGMARKAQKLALAGGEKELAEKNEALARLFETGKAYHQ